MHLHLLRRHLKIILPKARLDCLVAAIHVSRKNGEGRDEPGPDLWVVDGLLSSGKI